VKIKVFNLYRRHSKQEKIIHTLKTFEFQKAYDQQQNTSVFKETNELQYNLNLCLLRTWSDSELWKQLIWSSQTIPNLQQDLHFYL